MYGPVQCSTVEYSTVQYITMVINDKREPTFTGPLQYTIGQTDPDVYPDTDTDTDTDVYP